MKLIRARNPDRKSELMDGNRHVADVLPQSGADGGTLRVGMDGVAKRRAIGPKHVGSVKTKSRLPLTLGLRWVTALWLLRSTTN